MDNAAEMRRCLEELDVTGVRALYKHTNPGMPQPADDAAALAMIHHARTQSFWLTFTLRAYSHRWLLDHDLPSGLPDELKPKAERMYPVEVRAVGISMRGGGVLAPIREHIQTAMENAVLECFADGHQETDIVRPRMFEARSKAIDQLLGLKR